MRNSLTSILFEVYNPNCKLEDFLMAPNQHLPERSYPCSDCGKVFASAQEFSDHFLRDGFMIVGCKVMPQVATAPTRELPA